MKSQLIFPIQNNTSVKTTTDFCEAHQTTLKTTSSEHIKYIAGVQEVVARLAMKNAQTQIKLQEIDDAVQQVRLTTNESASEISGVATLLQQLQTAIESEHIESLRQVSTYNITALDEATNRTAVCKKLSTELQTYTDANTELLEKLKITHMEHNDGISANIEENIKCLDDQQTAVTNRLAELQSQIKALDITCSDAVQADACEMIKRVQQETQRMNTFENHCISLSDLMKGSLQEYADELTKQVLHCREKNEHFHRNDIQTYKSTGNLMSPH